MKQILLVIIFILIILPCISKEYICKWKEDDGSIYTQPINTKIFTQSVTEECDWLKSYSVNEYNRCAERFNSAKIKYKKLYQNGYCKEQIQ